jgi:Icc-related predicted phosphoesterase
MKIDCISDLHGFYPELEGGDLLIVAGDLTAKDEEDQYYEFNYWLCQQDYKRKIVIAGNHDNLLQDDSFQYLEGSPAFEYLCDSGTEFENLKIYGSPWTLAFPGMNPKCKAFTVDTEEELSERWALIPDDTDILITHSAPYGIFDKTERNKLAGSKNLLLRTIEIKPLIHCFGHIHEKGGKDLWVPWKNGTRFINASHVNEHYKPVNKPVRVIL